VGPRADRGQSSRAEDFGARRVGRGPKSVASQEPVPIQVALGTIGSKFSDELESEFFEPPRKFFVRDLVAIARGRGWVVSEPKKVVPRVEFHGIDGRTEQCADPIPCDLPSLESRATLELPGREGKQATGGKSLRGGGKQLASSFSPGNVVQDAHQADECEGAARQVAPGNWGGEEIVFPPFAAISQLRPQPLLRGREECGIGVRADVVKVEGRTR
jgi:hypothetical protein